MAANPEFISSASMPPICPPYGGEIHHQPWPLQDAHADFMVNTMAQAAGVGLPKSAPLLHFARRLEVLLWPLRRV